MQHDITIRMRSSRAFILFLSVKDLQREKLYNLMAEASVWFWGSFYFILFYGFFLNDKKTFIEVTK